MHSADTPTKICRVPNALSSAYSLLRTELTSLGRLSLPIPHIRIIDHPTLQRLRRQGHPTPKKSKFADKFANGPSFDDFVGGNEKLSVEEALELKETVVDSGA